MGPIGPQQARWLLFLLLLAVVPAHCQQTQSASSPPASLFSQSAAEILRRDFGTSGTSYLLLDAKTGVVMASRWDNPEKPIPMGSLVKPFTALAYGQAHDFHYPQYECKGKSNGCWQPRPHGKLDITSAVSVSCNAYFRRLAENVTLEQLRPVALSFGLDFPDAGSTSATLFGLGDQWRISPMHLAQAYLELGRRRNQPGVSPILEGMKQSAQRGTGAAVDRGLRRTKALVKTGTAPCTHSPWAPADGFVVALIPEDQPAILLFVRVHGVAGAKAAETAGQMLREMEE